MTKTLRLFVVSILALVTLAACAPDPVVASPTAGKNGTGPGAAPGAKAQQSEAPKAAGN